MTNLDHKHFVCPKCREIFCTAKPAWAKMVEGDPCPACHLANVTEVEGTFSSLGALSAGEAAVDEILEQLPEFIQRFYADTAEIKTLRERQVIALERIAKVLENAAQFGGNI